LRVNTNSTALSASVELDLNTQLIDKLSQQLSSGQRLNSAADDPSGLAISQSLLAQANGANQGVHNMQDTVSLLQTAEGGMRSIVDSIQRIRVLAVEAANDTLTDQQRQGMQVEVDQLKQHIDQVAKTTQFNNINLLDGTFDVQFVPTGTNTGNFLPDGSLSFNIGFQQLTVLVTPPANTSANGYDASLRVRNLGPLADSNLSVLNRLLANINGNGSGVTASLVADPSGVLHALQTTVSPGTKYSFLDGAGGTLAAVAGLNNVTVGQQGQYLNVQAGGAAGETIPLLIPNMSVASLGLTSVNIVSSSEAQTALNTLDQAIQSVSGDLSVLGAGENRLTQGSMAEMNESEMITAAHSGIVDANIPQAASQYASHLATQSMAEAVLTRAIQTTSGLSLLTVNGLRQRFPLVGSHIGLS
jgi:flagellin